MFTKTVKRNMHTLLSVIRKRNMAVAFAAVIIAVIGTNVMFNQGNSFYDNKYYGPWYFWPWEQSNTAYPVSFTDLGKPVTDKCMLPGQIASGTCSSGFGQDAGSTYDPTPL